ncbi:hypothetical protein CHS0354_026265 [Potamilus streckersoni]|uniref:Uncharacterized protein n=1 Tax=Potamilus streckersoni TaxID=2493646 RepID=A0AAE0W742_9BIVA|nr:hypothetical protein CHS0354_026265 [Potamilus streckersoni]
MADRKIYLCHYIILLTLGTADAVCTFPSQFQSSTYEDSYKGTLTFTANAMTGWGVVAYGNTVTNWQCHIVTSYSESSGGLLVFKATDSISALGASFYAYLCLNITKVTDNSFYYYQMNGIQPNAQNERVLISNDNTLSTVGTTCESSYSGHVAEFKVLLKSGMASTAAQNVSTELFANFDYNYTDASGATACASSSDNWVFCDTRVSMTFNFTTCSQAIAYGTSGIWYHIVTLSLTYKYMVVFNSAASHKFTCFTFTDDTKTTYVYDYCRSGQTNTALPTVGGATIGAKLTMAAYRFKVRNNQKSAF